MATKPKPVEKPIYRMSAAGKCPRALSAEKLSLEAAPAPSWLLSSGEEGKWHEERLIQQLQKEGYQIHQRQEEYVLDFPEFTLVGHIDGSADDGIFRRLLEIKSMSQYEFDRWQKGKFEAFPAYATQLSCYLEATGYPSALYIIKNRSSGYTERLHIYGYNLPPFEEIITSLSSTNRYVLLGELAPANYEPESLECRRCLYAAHCLPPPVELNGTDVALLDSATENYRKATAAIKEAEERKETAKNILQAYAQAQPSKRYRYGGLAISLSEIPETPISYIRKAYTLCSIKEINKA